MLNLASVETYLTTTLAGWLSKTKPAMSVVHDGTNTDLNAPISAAMRVMGYAVDSSGATDANLSLVPATGENAIFQVSMYYTVQAIVFRLSGVDEKGGPDETKYSQLRQDIMDWMKGFGAGIALQFGIGRPKGRTAVGALTAGAWPPPPPPPLQSLTVVGNPAWPPASPDDETYKPVGFNP